MDFSHYFSAQLLRYPKMQAQDLVKLCFQAAFGGEHIALDLNRAQNYFNAEYADTEPTDEPLFERISPEICRVHLGAWKKQNLPKDALFELFFRSAQLFRGDSERFSKFFEQAKTLVAQSGLSQKDRILAQLSQCDAAQPRPVHHSDEFRAAYRPAYRVAQTALVEEYLAALGLL